MRNLIIIIDGVGYDQLASLQPPGLMSLGRRTGIAPVQTLLSFSSGIYCSIWSGLYPEEHGVWTEFYRPSDKGARGASVYRPIPGKYLPRVLSFVFRTGLSRLGWKGQDHLAIPPGLQSCFRRTGSDYRLFPPVRIDPPPDFSLRLETGKCSWEYVYCDPMDRQTGSILLQAAERAETLIVCFPELDHAGHLFGPTSEAFKKTFLEFDRCLVEVIRSLEVGKPEFSLFIFSDHGMTRILRSFDIWSYLERAGFRLGRDYLAFINSTIVPFWFDHGHRQEIVDSLNLSGAGHVLTEYERALHHLRFPGDKFGEDFFLTDEGVECVPNFINLAQKKGRGMHGYDPRLSSTRAFFIGGEQIATKPRDIIDIHKVLEEVMLPRTDRPQAVGKEEPHVEP